MKIKDKYWVIQSKNLAWILTQKSSQAAWDKCERGDWMLNTINQTLVNENWMKGGMSKNERKTLVLCAAACVRTALSYDLDDENYAELAISAAEQFLLGDKTLNADEVYYFASEAWAPNFVFNGIDPVENAKKYDIAFSKAFSLCRLAAHVAYFALADGRSDNAGAFYMPSNLRHFYKKMANVVRKFYPETWWK